MRDIDPPVCFSGRRESAEARIRSLVDRACREMSTERLNMLAYRIAVHFLAIDGTDYQTADRVSEEIYAEQEQILQDLDPSPATGQSGERTAPKENTANGRRQNTGDPPCSR